MLCLRKGARYSNGSNRTFMELKLYEEFARAAGGRGSNRTFMELKSAICLYH